MHPQRFLLILCCLSIPAAAHGQGTPPTLQGTTVTLAPHYGQVRFDTEDAEWTDLFGGRIGLGFGGILGLNGFYWNGFDPAAREFDSVSAWGGEATINLNAGFGLTPYVAAGFGRVDFGADSVGTATDDHKTALIVGGGLTLPITRRIGFYAAARDYLIELDAGADELTHNWVLTAGASLTLGGEARGARSPEVAEGVPPLPSIPGVADTSGAAPADAAQPAGRDSQRPAAGQAAEAERAGEGGGAAPTVMPSPRTGPATYQSTRQLTVPIPTEGEIVLRYGPRSDSTAAAEDERIRRAVREALVDWMLSGGGLAAAGGQTGDSNLSGVRPSDISPDAERRIAASVTESVLARFGERFARLEERSRLAEPGRDQIAPADSDIEARLRRLEAAAMDRSEPVAGESMDRRLARLEAAILADRDPVARDRPTAPASETPALETPASESGATDSLAQALNRLADRLEGGASVRSVPEGLALNVGRVAFESGSSTLSPNSRSAVEQIAQALRTWPEARIAVHGHTDSSGSQATNEELSLARARSVRAALIAAGLPRDRVEALGFGSRRPIADNATPEGRTLNRRVEVVVSTEAGRSQ